MKTLLIAAIITLAATVAQANERDDVFARGYMDKNDSAITYLTGIAHAALQLHRYQQTQITGNFVDQCAPTADEIKDAIKWSVNAYLKEPDGLELTNTIIVAVDADCEAQNGFSMVELPDAFHALLASDSNKPRTRS